METAPAEDWKSHVAPELHCAAYAGREDVVKKLLQDRADVNSRDLLGQTPLFFASSRSICEVLLEAGADVNAMNDGRQTALHFAAWAGLVESLEWLSTTVSPSSINAMDAVGCTAADYAAKSRSKSAARLLRLRGARRAGGRPSDSAPSTILSSGPHFPVAAPGGSKPQFVRRRYRQSPHRGAPSMADSSRQDATLVAEVRKGWRYVSRLRRGSPARVCQAPATQMAPSAEALVSTGTKAKPVGLLLEVVESMPGEQVCPAQAAREYANQLLKGWPGVVEWKLSLPLQQVASAAAEEVCVAEVQEAASVVADEATAAEVEDVAPPPAEEPEATAATAVAAEEDVTTQEEATDALAEESAISKLEVAAEPEQVSTPAKVAAVEPPDAKQDQSASFEVHRQGPLTPEPPKTKSQSWQRRPRAKAASGSSQENLSETPSASGKRRFEDISAQPTQKAPRPPQDAPSEEAATNTSNSRRHSTSSTGVLEAEFPREESEHHSAEDQEAGSYVSCMLASALVEHDRAAEQAFEEERRLAARGAVRLSLASAASEYKTIDAAPPTKEEGHQDERAAARSAVRLSLMGASACYAEPEPKPSPTEETVPPEDPEGPAEGLQRASELHHGSISSHSEVQTAAKFSVRLLLESVAWKAQREAARSAARGSVRSALEVAATGQTTLSASNDASECSYAAEQPSVRAAARSSVRLLLASAAHEDRIKESEDQRSLVKWALNSLWSRVAVKCSTEVSQAHLEFRRQSTASSVWDPLARGVETPSHCSDDAESPQVASPSGNRRRMSRTGFLEWGNCEESSNELVLSRMSVVTSSSVDETSLRSDGLEDNPSDFVRYCIGRGHWLSRCETQSSDVCQANWLDVPRFDEEEEMAESSGSSALPSLGTSLSM
mmetsp:Transcript_35641/g.83374  ORF Transcript_35641/g.83374 Transcript_35641/m.83374 type:complete len:895 (-) Transcript_35641:82-2766(-)